MFVIALVSAGGSLPNFFISDFLSLRDLGTADKMDAVGYLDAASDSLCEAVKCFVTILCPYVFVFY